MAVNLIERSKGRWVGSGNEGVPPTKLATRLRTLRVYAGMSQADLAPLVARGSQSRISNWENGIHIPTLQALQLYAAAFNTTVARILDGVM